MAIRIESVSACLLEQKHVSTVFNGWFEYVHHYFFPPNNFYFVRARRKPEMQLSYRIASHRIVSVETKRLANNNSIKDRCYTEWGSSVNNNNLLVGRETRISLWNGGSTIYSIESLCRDPFVVICFVQIRFKRIWFYSLFSCSPI